MARLLARHRARCRWDGPVSFTRYDEKGWRAIFCTTGIEHSPTSATGASWGARRGVLCSWWHGKRWDDPVQMARPRILLVGGHPLLAAMFTEHLHRGDCYELESVQYCDDALEVLQGRPFDLVLVLSLHVPWRRWPRSYSPARHIN